jgi:hypothetical protein
MAKTPESLSTNAAAIRRTALLRLLGSAPLLLLALPSVALAEPEARPAEAPSSEMATATPPAASYADRFFRGGRDTNPGTPSPAKLATVSTLYSLGVASLGAGIWMGLESLSTGSDADAIRDTEPSDFCVGYTSPSCRTYRDLRAEQRNEAALSYLFLSGAVISLATGAVLAELWPNVVLEGAAVGAAVAPGGAMVEIKLAF